MGTDVAAVRAAIQARASHILENKDTLSMKGLRKLLEQDLGLAEGALKEHKETLEADVGTIIAGATAPATAGDAGGENGGGGKALDDAAPSNDSAPSDDSEDEAPKKKEVKKKRAPPAATKPGVDSRQYSGAVNRLKAVAKAATITVPPTLYVKYKGDAELQAALEDLLAGHGLSATSEPRAIERVKRKLEAARELDGIDTSNIVEAAPGSFSAMLKAPRLPGDSGASDDDDSGDDGSDGDSDTSGATASEDSEDEPRRRKRSSGKSKGKVTRGAPAKKKAKAAASDNDDSGSDGDSAGSGSDSGDGEPGASPTKDSPAKASPAKASPAKASPAKAGGGGGGVKAWSDDDD